MSGYLLAKYNTQTTFTFPVVKRAVVDLAVSADWTPATGDTKVSKDGGNVANTTNNPAAVGGTGSALWSITLTATELSAAEIVVQIVDSATKAIEDQVLRIYTYGNASAKFVADFSAAGMGAVMPTVAGRTLDVTTTGEAGLDFANVNLPVGAIIALGWLENGTLQSATSSTAVLRSATSIVDDLIIGATLVIRAGTGAGQSRIIHDWVNSTDTASISPNWTTTPDNTSDYYVVPTPPAATNAAALPTALVDAASVRTAVGMASANLDTQLTTIDDFLDTEIAAIKTKTDFLPSATAGAAGGLLIAGSNAATTFATWTVTGATTHTGNFSMAAGLNITQSTANATALVVTGNGTGNGATFTSGSGATGQALNLTSAATNGSAFVCTGAGTGSGASFSGGASGIGARFVAGATGTAGAAFVGGSTSGSAATFTTTAGDAVQMIATAGNGLTVTANGTSKHGAVFTGGTAGTSDGFKCVAGTGGLDFRGDITKNAMTESYAADGAAPTLAQALFLTQQAVMEVSVSGTTMTIKKIDKSTTAATCTLDSATTPTSRTRAA